MSYVQKKDAIKYRLLILYTWCICYAIILISYCLIQSKTTRLTEALGYFSITSAIILPQLTVIISFFYKKSESEIQDILKNTPHAKFAFYCSLLFILIYTFLVIISYPLPKVTNYAIDIFSENPDWEYPNASVTIAKIMGNVMFFSTAAITYLFGKGEK